MSAEELYALYNSSSTVFVIPAPSKWIEFLILTELGRQFGIFAMGLSNETNFI
jgi:hypothetical protein